MLPHLPVRENFIHPTAIVDPSVQLGHSNYIGPYCVIGADVIIGNNNRFEAFCSVGTAPEHASYWHGNYASVVIGDYCMIREYITINAGTVENTKIGSHCVILRGAHVGHDSVLEEAVTLSCNVMVGGHSYLFKGCNIGLSAVMHQYSVIGHYSMIGMSSVITKQTIVTPGMVVAGNPAQVMKKNEIGLQRNRISSQDLLLLNSVFTDKKKSLSKAG